MRRILSTVALVVLALAVGFWDGFAYRMAGFKPLQTANAKSLDLPIEVDERDAPRFLAERDEVEVEVPRDMTAGEFLRLLQFEDFTHVRQQIAQQEGLDALRDETLLRQGRRYKIRLTPPAEGIP